MKHPILFLFCVMFATSALGQNLDRRPWIEISERGQEKQPSISLNDILAPLSTSEAEDKVAFLIINKTYGDTLRQSIFDKLPNFDTDIFVPFVTKYDGRSKVVEFRNGADIELSLDNVDRSRAYLMSQNPFWIEHLRNNQNKLSIIESREFQNLAPDMVVYSIECSALRQHTAETTYESEFWYLTRNIVAELNQEGAKRKVEILKRQRLRDLSFSASAFSINARSNMGVNSSGSTNWSSQESQAFVGWSQEFMILHSLTEFNNLGIEPWKFGGGSLEPQIGVSFLQKSCELKSQWDDMQGLDITSSQTMFGKNEQLRMTSRGIEELLTLGSIQSVSLPVAAVWRPDGDSNIGLRVLVGPGVARAKASSELVQGEFDYFLTSSTAPGEALTAIPSLGLSEENQASGYDAQLAYLRGSSMSYNLDALVFKGSNIWTLGGYFTTMSMDMVPGHDDLPSTSRGAFTSTWAGQTIRLREWGFRVGLSFSSGKR